MYLVRNMKKETTPADNGQTHFPDKRRFKDVGGKYLTQSLFLEHGYDVEKAVYTFNSEDKEYKGVVYPSLRRLYLEASDPTEYDFANRYLYDWEHWMRIVGNKTLLVEIEPWRDELEIKLRSEGVRRALNHGLDTFAAAKWAADGHWNVKRGRPTKADKKKEDQIREEAYRSAVSDGERVAHLINRDK